MIVEWISSKDFDFQDRSHPLPHYPQCLALLCMHGWRQSILKYGYLSWLRAVLFEQNIHDLFVELEYGVLLECHCFVFPFPFTLTEFLSLFKYFSSWGVDVKYLFQNIFLFHLVVGQVCSQQGSTKSQRQRQDRAASRAEEVQRGTNPWSPVDCVCSSLSSSCIGAHSRAIWSQTYCSWLSTCPSSSMASEKICTQCWNHA